MVLRIYGQAELHTFFTDCPVNLQTVGNTEEDVWSP